MDMTIRKSEFSNALAKVQGIVEKKNTVPILSSVLLETKADSLAMSATDLEIFLRSRYPAQVGREGTVTAPAKKLFEIVRELPEGDLRLTTEDKGWLRLEMGRARFKVMSLPKEDFPGIPLEQEGERIEFSPGVLVEAIEKTAFAMSHDQTRQALNGILLEVSPTSGGEADLRLVATDGHRLAFVRRTCRAEVAGERGVIVPRKAITELRKLLGDAEGSTVTLAFQENRLFFTIGSSILVTRIVDGQFPDYRQVIPSAGSRVVTVEREGFYRSLRRVSTLTAERVNLVRMALKPGRLAVTAVNPEIGEANEDMEAVYEGGEFEMGMNSRYLLDVLAVLGQEKVTLEMSEALSPVLIRTEGDEGFRCVIMPMRL